jgi:hypothetical protein
MKPHPFSFPVWVVTIGSTHEPVSGLSGDLGWNRFLLVALAQVLIAPGQGPDWW